MRRRTAARLRRLAQRLDPAPAPKPLFPSITFTLPEIKIDAAKIGREIEQIRERHSRSVGRPLGR